MNAESAAFVPSSRGRKLSLANSSSAANDNGHVSQTISNEASNLGSSNNSKIPRSTSANNSPALHDSTSSSKFGTAGNATGQSSTTSTSNHSRSSSLPGNNGASSTSSRGRGTSTRGRGSTRGGRGGSRGGSTHGSSNTTSSSSSSSSSHLPKKVSSPPSRPPVALDSVDEFPALGGGPLPTTSSSTTTTSTGNEEKTAAPDSSSPAISKSSPTLSPSMSMKGLSFARVVAPAPPPSSTSTPSSTTHPAQQSSSSSSHANAPLSLSSSSTPSISSQSQSANHSGISSVSENTRATSPSTSLSPNLDTTDEGTHGDKNATSAAGGGKGQPGQASTGTTTGAKKKKKRSSKDQVAQQQQQGAIQGQHQGQSPHPHQQDAFNMYNGNDGAGVMYPEGYESNPFGIVLPGGESERPYFDPQQVPGGGPQSPPQPQPGLTPVQIAFLAANGLSIEGMPNLPNEAAAGMSLEALQEYYAPLQLPESDHSHQQASSSTSKGNNKKEGNSSKKGKKGDNRNQAGHPGAGDANMNGWNGNAVAQGQGGPYGSFDPQASQYPYYDPQFYDEAQFAQYQQEQQQQQPFDEQYQQQPLEQGGEGANIEQTQQQQQPQFNRANGSFHFHPDVPSFQPRHFSPDAQEFKPRSPVLHADAPAFVPPTESHTSSVQEEEGKAPNGFVSATASTGAEETPKATTGDLPRQEETIKESSHSEQEGEAQSGDAPHADTEAEAPVEEQSRTEQIQARIEDTIESMKQAASDLISGEPVEAVKKAEEPKEEATTSATEQAPLAEDDENKDEEEERNEESIPEQAEGAQSPPHSTFSLLPPVTVEDVLDKAQSMADSIKETAQDAVEVVQETVQSAAETVSETFTSGNAEQEEEGAESSDQHTKDNLDELDIPNEEETSIEDDKSEVGATSTQETISNLDELDIPDSKEIDEQGAERHSKESSSTSASGSLAPDMSQYSLSPSEVEHELTNATEGAADMPALQAEIDAIAQSSFPASTPQFEIVSRSEEQCPVETSEVEIESSSQPEKTLFEIISTSTDVCDVAIEGNGTVSLGPCSDIQIISTSEDQCNTEDETRGSRSATLDSLASTESATSFVRSTAPSPSPRQEELAPTPATTKPGVPALTIPIQTPPVVISPSTPISPTSGSPLRPSALSSPKPLSKTWQPQRPEPTRQVSEAEKDEAIRLVRQLRSEPSTPLLESEDMLGTTSTSNGGTTANASTIGESTESDTFKFDLSGRFSELNSSKRKRGKADDQEEEEDPDKKERKVDSGEAPSLTMSIFSGSILPRKQFIVSIFASLGINLFLPFVNGVMLGFGEIFARDWLGPLFGFGRNRSSSTSSDTSNKSFSASGLGIRGAGNKQRGGAQDVPGHAAAKTAVETVTEEIVQAPARL